MWSVANDDILKWAEKYRGSKFQAILTDPPYHLVSVTKRFGNPDSAPAKEGTNGLFRRASAGFMGERWDGGSISFESDTWAAIRSLMHPGAFGLAFASARGWHRMAVAIEDAGFVFHPTVFLLGWAYGSGFPKATRVDRQVEDGAKWAGHRYGLQTLKPAIEPILLFQNPYHGRPIDNISQTGAGALNVDEARISGISSQDDARLGGKGTWKTDKMAQNVYQGGYAGIEYGSSNGGRWPANLVLQHAPGCVIVGYEDEPGYEINRWEDNAHPFGGGAGNDYQSSQVPGSRVPVWKCEPGCPVEAMNRQSGVSKSGVILPHHHSSGTPPIGTFNIWDRTGETRPAYGDEGYASRFFQQVDERLDECEPFLYTSKAGALERELGLDGLDIKEVKTHGEMGADPSGKSHNTTGQLPARRRNHHPTIKPLSLTSYLAGLLLPPPEYAPRRLLVPFAGSGSEMIGGLLAGWEDITGIELKAEYVEIGLLRVAWWEREIARVKTHDPRQILEIHGKNKPVPQDPSGPQQLGLFDEEK